MVRLNAPVPVCDSLLECTRGALQSPANAPDDEIAQSCCVARDAAALAIANCSYHACLLLRRSRGCYGHVPHYNFYVNIAADGVAQECAAGAAVLRRVWAHRVVLSVIQPVEGEPKYLQTSVKEVRFDL